MLLAALPASAPAAAVPVPAWASIAISEPTNLPPGGQGKIFVYVQNVGGAPSSGTVTVEDQLPPGLTVAADATGAGWECLSPGPGAITCTRTQSVAAGLVGSPIEIPVSVGAAAETAANRVVVSGGGAVSSAVDEEPVVVSPTPAGPGTQVFSSGVHAVDGGPSTQAGSHPFIVTSAVFVNTVVAGGQVVPAGELKRIAVAQPPGFLGNPTATPGCVEGVEDSECPLETQVGVAQLVAGFPGHGLEASAVHSAREPLGYPARFTFSSQLGNEVIQTGFFADIRSDEDYSTVFDLSNAPRIRSKTIYGAFLTLWGVPADPLHDQLRCTLPQFGIGCGPSKATPRAFLTQPTDCALQAAQPPFESLSFEAWGTPGEVEQRQLPVPAVTGCEQLEFGASLTLDPSVAEASSPAAFEARLTAAPGGLNDPDGLAASPVRTADVELPAGVGINASVADGLGTCSQAEIGLRGVGFSAPTRIRFDQAPNRCPDAAKIGTAEVESALLEDPLAGTLYLAAPDEGNPFGSLIALYLVVEDRATGIVMKLPGRVALDPRNGQVTVAFEDLPQIPLTSIELSFKGGSRSLLATPSTCGEFLTVATSTPWSAPESGPSAVSRDSFAIDSGPGGGACARSPRDRPFDLGFQAGTASAAAGQHSPLTLRLSRPDGAQELERISLALPAGLAASLKGVATCTEAQLAGLSCPARSQVGAVAIGAGVGPRPFFLRDGRAYLAGPYRGAPLSLAFLVPVVAGPFDLGTEVVRAALRVDPETARLTVESDALPQVLEGIPAKVKDLRVDLDRPGFMLNPTSCDPMSIAGSATGSSGAVAKLSTRFQVGGCAGPGFKPKLALSFKGAPTRRGGHPQMRAVLRARPGDANIGAAAIVLPETEYLDNSHIETICTRARFALRSCPTRSIYGYAKAWSPLLDEPLQGPVYLRSSDSKLPDLVASLDGQIRIDLAGRIDSVHGRIRNTFAALPDVPVSRFELTMKGGRRGLLVNNTQLCRAKPRAGVFFRGQNGKARRAHPAVKVGCGEQR